MQTIGITRSIPDHFDHSADWVQYQLNCQLNVGHPGRGYIATRVTFAHDVLIHVTADWPTIPDGDPRTDKTVHKLLHDAMDELTSKVNYILSDSFRGVAY